jgi:hypothetical protein
MCLEDITLVPLYARDGSVRAYTLIDTADATWVNQHRWCVTSDERAGRIVSGMVVYLHREIMNVSYGNPIIIDHINRQHLDNRRCNLREVTAAQNAQNRSKKAPASSPHRGVTLKKANPRNRTVRDKWVARAANEGRMHHVGHYNTEEEAVEAVRAFRLSHMTHALD